MGIIVCFNGKHFSIDGTAELPKALPFTFLSASEEYFVGAQSKNIGMIQTRELT